MNTFRVLGDTVASLVPVGEPLTLVPPVGKETSRVTRQSLNQRLRVHRPRASLPGGPNSTLAMGHPNVSLCLSHPPPLLQGNEAAKRWLICTPVWPQPSCADRRSGWQTGAGGGGGARAGVRALEGRSEDERGWGTETGHSHGGQGNLRTGYPSWNNGGSAGYGQIQAQLLPLCFASLCFTGVASFID